MKTNLRILSAGLAVFMLVLFNSAQAASISGLYNTGVDDSHALLGDGDIDTHYVIVPSWTAIAGDNPPPGFEGAWILNSASAASRWIAPVSAPGAGPEQIYHLTLGFTIGAGFDPATASFTGRWATDNAGEVFLNGGTGSLGDSGGFGDWSSFSASSGFVSGLNTLDFHVTNFAFGGTNPTGLRVEFLSSTVNAIPEPEIYAMMAAGLGLMGFVARRRKQ